jgi:hypothetical protein
MRKLAIAAALSAALFPFSAWAENIQATLTGYEEVPALSTPASGQFRALISNHDQFIDYQLMYSGLETPVLAAHIHLGQSGVNAGVSAFLCGGGGKDPCPQGSGTVTGTIVAADVIGPTGQGIAPGELSELIRAIRSGATYANVHTERHPGGEIRGQISASSRP